MMQFDDIPPFIQALLWLFILPAIVYLPFWMVTQ